MTDKLEIIGRDIEITDSIRDFVQKKTSKLERHLNSMSELRIELVKINTARSSNDKYVAELTVRGKQLLLRSEERADNIRTALAASVEKMYRRMERFKGKHYHGRGDGRSVGAIEENSKKVKPKKEPEIIRRKKFDLEPMRELEAIAQMKMLGHDKFFVFFNIETEKINVAYRRRDGTYGLIEPRT